MGARQQSHSGRCHVLDMQLSSQVSNCFSALLVVLIVHSPLAPAAMPSFFTGEDEPPARPRAGKRAAGKGAAAAAAAARKAPKAAAKRPAEQKRAGRQKRGRRELEIEYEEEREDVRQRH